MPTHPVNPSISSADLWSQWSSKLTLLVKYLQNKKDDEVKSLLPLAFKAPVKGVPVGILPYCLVCKNQNARCGYSKVVKV